MADAGLPPRGRRLVVPAAALLAALLTTGLIVGPSLNTADPAPESSPRATTSAATSPSPSPTPEVPGLLPNLRSLVPSNISVERVGARLSLRFDGTLANVGIGPLEVVPDEQTPCPRGQRHASQSIYQDGDADGRFDAEADQQTTLRPAGCLLFHPEHTHWHLDASARYALTAAADGAVMVEQNKVSFCLRDNVRVPDGSSPPGKRAYGKCARDRVQGISVGWADVYDATLAGQELRLPRSMANGVYCLRVEADPLDLLVESDEDDNGAVRAIRIRGANVSRAPAASCT